MKGARCGCPQVGRSGATASLDRPVNLAPPLFSVLPRSKASTALLAAAVVMATVATTLVAAVPLYSNAIIEAGLRSTLADAPPAESGVEAAFRSDAAGWARTVDRLDAIGAARLPGRVDTVTLARTATYSLPEALAGGEDGTGRITSIGVLTGADDLLSPIDAPVAPGPDAIAATLHVDAATELGLAVGDRIELSRSSAPPLTLAVVGLFEPVDRADERWFDQPVLRDGLTVNGSFTEVGPFVVSPEAFTSIGGTANYRWRVIVDPVSVTTADLEQLRRGASGMEAAIGDALDVASLDVTTRLPSLAAATDTAIGATAAVIAAILLQLVGVALYGVGLSASVLVSSRAVETSMLRSRGASPEQLGAMAAAEAVLISLPAVAFGPWLATRVVELTERWGPVAVTGLDLQPTMSLAAVAGSVAVGVLVVAIVTWPAVRSARGFARAQAERARPEGPLFLQRTGLDIAAIALAVLGLWRLRGSSAATSDLAGRLGTDPVLVLAPTLGVIAASLMTLRLIALVAAVSQRYTSSQGALSLALAGWELARRPGRTARTSVLIVLSVTVGAFAAVHGASWERSQRDQADAAVSADAVIVPDGRPTSSVAAAFLPSAYRQVEGIEAIMPVHRPTASWSTAIGSVPVIAADVRALDDVLRVRDDLAGEGDHAALHAPGDLQPIELGTVSSDMVIDYRLSADASLARGDIEVMVTVLDGNGTLVRVPAERIALDAGAGTITVPLTSAAVPGYDLAIEGPVRLIEIEVAAPSVQADANVTPRPEHAVFDLQLGPARLGDRSVALDADWAVIPAALPSAVEPAEVTRPAGPGLRLRLDTGLTEQTSADLVVRAGTAAAGVGDGFTVPAFVTPTLLDASAASVGDVVTVRIGGSSVDVSIAGVVPVVPFATDQPSAILLDWETYNVDRWSRGRRIEVVDEWALVAEAGAIAEIRATVSGDPFGSTGFADRRQRSRDIARAPVAVGLSGSLGLAIAASLVVAAFGLVLTAVVGARERRPAFAVLRALGTRAGELRRWLLLETLPLVGLSAAAGALAGVALARLGLPSLAVSAEGRRAVPTPQLVIPWATLAIIVAIAATAGMALPIATARLLRRHRTADELRIGDTS